MSAMRIANAHTPYHEELVDITIDGGRIVDVRKAGANDEPQGDDAPRGNAAAPNTSTSAVKTVDAAGRLVSPCFVDAHFHLDAVLSRVANKSGTLAEGVRNWTRYKETTLSVDDVRNRAAEYLERAIRMGIGAVRSHVDVCDSQLRGVTALLEIREEFRNRIDIELVAFPQEGLYSDGETLHRLETTLDMGIDVVGGIPHYERSAQLGTRSLTTLLEIAADRGLPVDIHCDESDDPLSRHVEHLAAETIRLGLQGQVTASHVTSMATMDPYYVDRRLIPLMAEAHLNVIANPLVNVHLGGRHSHPSHRGMTPIKKQIAAGINVACGQDCNEDPWYPLGNADMLEVAKMGAHLGHMMGVDELNAMFTTVTNNPAQIMGFDDYGVESGDRANLVILDAPNVFEAIRICPPRVAAIRDGLIVFRTPGFGG